MSHDKNEDTPEITPKGRRSRYLLQMAPSVGVSGGKHAPRTVSIELEPGKWPRLHLRNARSRLQPMSGPCPRRRTCRVIKHIAPFIKGHSRLGGNSNSHSRCYPLVPEQDCARRRD